MYLLSYYVPESDHEKVKTALFDAGAGQTQLYDQCCWQTLGQGQFRPLKGSNPSIGESGKLSKVSEFKVEMICEDDLIAKVVKVLLDTHPYEEPAYHVIQIYP